MEIILQNYIELLKKVIKDAFDLNLERKLKDINPIDNVMNYISLVSSLDASLCEIAKTSLKTIIETIDSNYKSSYIRKKQYYVKSYHERTIITIFGEITYNRHFYTSKLSSKNYCYVDRFLGLHKYDYFDPYIKALILQYSADNSMPKTAKYVNDIIGNRVCIEDKFKYISRQTVRNIILKANLSNIKTKRTKTPKELYIIADEKWIHTQNNNNKDVMQKSIVIFENIYNHKLINKMSFSSIDDSFLVDSLYYLYDRYDTEKLEKIYFMGDGAKWIKSLRNEFKFHKDLDVIYGLDKFHFKQALHHLCFNKTLEDILKGYILSNMKDEFNYVCECLINNTPHRADTILEKQIYINKNWRYINNMYEFKLSCPMESQISHNIASLFTSRPKGFSINMINKLTHLRMLFKNNFNIKKLFLNNFNSKLSLNLNNEQLNSNIISKFEHNLIPEFPESLYSIPFDTAYFLFHH